MPRVVSFIVLVAIVLLVASLFFQVMAQFILPLFLAGVLVVVFDPLHDWMLEKCSNRSRLAAGLTTLTILLIVLIPLSGVFWNAYREGVEAISGFQSDTSGEVWTKMKEKATGVIRLLEKVGLDEEHQAELIDAGITKLRELAVPLAVGGMKLVVRTLVGLIIMLLALYYFLADGPGMVATIMRLSPLDDKYELELLHEFGRISRAVVVATLLSAFVQGVLAGIGFYFAGVGPVFFLTGLTMLLAMVPFVGAAAVWVPTCAWLYLFGGGVPAPETAAAFATAAAGDAAANGGSPVAAIVLAIYCLAIVSTSDNVVKPFVLHGQSNLHPLLALLSVLGGATALGPIGILVGPMAVAFLQALLKMLHTEIESFDKPRPATAGALSTERTATAKSSTSEASPKDASTSRASPIAPEIQDPAAEDPGQPDGSPRAKKKRRRPRH